MTSLLSIRDLACTFDTARGPLQAVRGVSLDIEQGETLALVGESGCGKTTLAKSIVGLVQPRSGSIELRGQTLLGLSRREARQFRRNVQFIFQDPFSSLNPRRQVETLIREPLDVHAIGTPAERRRRVHELMERVGLRPDWGRRFPHEFSGGQRQRIGIARALALNPSLIVCDEPVSALDVSVQAQIINLLADLQKDLGLSYLFISHDLTLVETFADRVAVMYLGEIVETGPSERIWSAPCHPFTQALIAAVPVPDPNVPMAENLALQGDPPSPIDLPAGCAFSPRCRFSDALCERERPGLRPIGDVRVACHHAEKFAAIGATMAPEIVGG